MKVDVRSVERAQRVFAANVSPRAQRLDWLERYANGTQYEGRPSFWDDSVPLQERAPCIVVPIPERAAESNVDLCFGEGRAPTFAIVASEEDAVFDARLGISEDDAETVTRFIGKVCDQADLTMAAGDLLHWAQIHGTTCAIACAKNGELCVDREDAKWVTPTFEPNDPDCVASVEIRYPFLEDYTDDAGQLCKRCMLYRRVIDSERDVCYHPAPASENGKEPDAWIEDFDKTTSHGLGFCPVRWYRFGKRGASRALDGQAIHALMTDEVDAYNFARSQIHRASLYASDPQIIEIGVEPEHKQAPTGRPASIYLGPGDDPNNENWILYGPHNRPVKQGGGTATRRGPGVTWRYPEHESRVDLLTLPGDALKPAEDNAAKLYATIKEMLGVVFVDPEHTKLGADISGRALEWLHSKQIDRCNRIRKDFARRMLVPLLHMLLRIALKSKGALYIPGLDKAKKLLERFEREVEGSATPRWFGPEIRVTWGPYFKPTATDAKTDTDNAIAAKDAGIITLKTAVESVKSHYPSIGDTAEYIEELEEAAQEKAEKALAAMHALGGPPAGQEGDDDAQTGEPVKPFAKKAPVTNSGRPKAVAPMVKPKLPAVEARAPKARKPPVVKKAKRAAEQPFA